jgi:uncharacterized protein YabN with tetrapyrrole methylase and pyrophosphatase domain
MIKFKKSRSAIQDLLRIMADLRSPEGCPWDREQDHMTLRFHAVEEVYELMDAIEAGDDHEMREELGDLLLQVVFHCQLAKERGVFDFEGVARAMTEKLVRRHPHVYGDSKVSTVDGVWSQWDTIKNAEKAGTHRERTSALDGIPKHLPALLRAEKLVKKARKAKLAGAGEGEGRRGAGKGSRKEMAGKGGGKPDRKEIAEQLFELAAQAQAQGWSAEDLLRREIAKREKEWRRKEKAAR